MLDSIPLPLFYEWIEYAGLNPFGEDRADLRSARIASVMANAWRGKGVPRFKPADFMLMFDKGARRMSQGQMKANWMGFVAAQNAAVAQRANR